MKSIFSEIIEKLRNGQVIFFLGAGASADAPANLPISSALFREFASRLLISDPERKRNQIVSRLEGKLRFEVFFQLFTNVFSESAIDMLGILESGQPNYIHAFIANLASQNLSPLVATTNFDSLLEKALVSQGSVDFDLLYSSDDFKKPLNKNGRFQVIKLHGSLRNKSNEKVYNSIQISINQVGRNIEKDKINCFKMILKKYDIIFVGYSGMDDFDLLPILLKTKSDKSIYWINHISVPGLNVMRSHDVTRRLDSVAGSNCEKAVSSRKNGYLIEGSTSSFISGITYQLFKDRMRPQKSRRTIYDFSYLDNWEKLCELPTYRNYLAGMMFIEAGEYKHALKYLRKVPAESDRYHMSIIQQAVALKYSNSAETARDLLVQLINNASTPQSIVTKALIQLGFLESEHNNFTIARRHLFRAARMGPENDTDLSTLHNNLGISYLIESELFELSGKPRYTITYRLNRAIESFNLARRITIRMGNPYQLANIDDNLALSYGFLGKFKQAKSKHFEALRNYRSLYQRREEASCLDNIGVFYKKQGNYPLALRYYLDAHKMKEKYSTLRRLALTKHNLGEIYYLSGDKKNALKWLLEAKSIFKDENLLHYLDSVSRMIEEVKST